MHRHICLKNQVFIWLHVGHIKNFIILNHRSACSFYAILLRHLHQMQVGHFMLGLCYLITIILSPSLLVDPKNLATWLAKLHRICAMYVNQLDSSPGRQVWHQFWDSRITIHTSYLARLHYVHQNPVKHGIVADAAQYPWCSAAAFEIQASKAFVKTVYSFKLDKLNVYDQF